jgi:hypothetical protein
VSTSAVPITTTRRAVLRVFAGVNERFCNGSLNLYVRLPCSYWTCPAWLVNHGAVAIVFLLKAVWLWLTAHVQTAEAGHAKQNLRRSRLQSSRATLSDPAGLGDVRFSVISDCRMEFLPSTRVVLQDSVCNWKAGLGRRLCLQFADDGLNQAIHRRCNGRRQLVSPISTPGLHA